MRTIAAVLLWMLLVGGLQPLPVNAAENTFEAVFKDGFYGGLAGALVGGAALAFRDHPGDHLNYLSYGAAIGVFVGVTFGLATISRSLAEIDDHKLVFHLPVPEIASVPVSPTRRERITSVGLFKVRF